jgi:hypothetical protein
MTLNRGPVRVARGMSAWYLPGPWAFVAARQLRLPLVALDIETLAAHGHDQSLDGQRGQGPLGCAVGDSVFLGQSQDAGHAPGNPAICDHRPQDAR